jgi:hypothetical protein
MGLWQYLDLSLSWAMMFRRHMSFLPWLWPYYVIPIWWILSIIGWFLRCEPLLCSWCMNRCILLLHSLNLLWSNMYTRACVSDGVY